MMVASQGGREIAYSHTYTYIHTYRRRQKTFPKSFTVPPFTVASRTANDFGNIFFDVYCTYTPTHTRFMSVNA